PESASPRERAAPARRFLARLSGVEAVCWIGACLADALHHAHERGMAHLDIKPSNVLPAADGQPMLLHFPLAREPPPAHGAVPEWFGGTPVYMSPEQRQALAAVTEQRPLPVAVDSRSDVYSLGRLLYEALGGPAPVARARDEKEEPLPPLHRCNPAVSVGLSDVIHKCLAAEPARRYAHAASPAADPPPPLQDL